MYTIGPINYGPPYEGFILWKYPATYPSIIKYTRLGTRVPLGIYHVVGYVLLEYPAVFEYMTKPTRSGARAPLSIVGYILLEYPARYPSMAKGARFSTRVRVYTLLLPDVYFGSTRLRTIMTKLPGLVLGYP